jgi:hypothetical protein
VVDDEDEAQIFAYDDGASQAKVSLSGYESLLETTDRLLGYGGGKLTSWAASDLDEEWEARIAIDSEEAQGAAVGGTRLFVVTEDDLTAYG